MTNRYNALNNLQNTTVGIANFLLATARRAKSPEGLSAEAIHDRLVDCAQELTAAANTASRLFFEPDNSGGSTND